MSIQPKILVFTVSSWNSRVGANTWATLLEQYGSENIANICIRDELPDSPVCSRYFCVSENKVLKSIFNRKIKTGKEIHSLQEQSQENTGDLIEHNRRYQKYRKKRSYLMLLMRECVWKIGKWKTKELNEFLDDFKPNIILHSMEGYIHLNRMIEYAIERTKANAIGYIWDDNFTYKQSTLLGYKIYRYFQRKSLKRLAKKTKQFFAITPKTKKEADSFFGIECRVLTKPLNCIPECTTNVDAFRPIQILYTGNLLIGRDVTLRKIVKVLKSIPNVEEKIELNIYTQTQLDDQSLHFFNCGFCHIYSAIPQLEVLQKQKEADVLLFLEDIDGKNSKTARLSFSTKITDYLSSGKCIFAVGNKELAPIEYLKENEAALVACDQTEIEREIARILTDRYSLITYAQKAVECGLKNHNPQLIRKQLNDVIISLLQERETENDVNL